MEDFQKKPNEVTFIYIPGLGDSYDKYRQKKLNGWQKKGISVCFFPMKWYAGRTLAMQIAPLMAEIAERSKAKKDIFLIGESAGATIALSLYANFPSAISGVILVAGVAHPDMPVAKSIQNNAPAFVQSMKKLQTSIPKLTGELRKRILTVQGVLDQVVPPKFSSIEGASSKKIYQIGHILTIRKFLTSGHRIAGDFAQKSIESMKALEKESLQDQENSFKKATPVLQNQKKPALKIRRRARKI